jgi:SAM-dependent methyltransferase
MFQSAQHSHAHSLTTLNILREYDDFLESIGTMADLGCGNGLDLEWWATLTTRDEEHVPLNIKCTGIDLVDDCHDIAKKYKNAVFSRQDLENLAVPKHGYDLLWCHDTFQYMINPLQALSSWWHAMNKDGMLIITVPQSTNLEFNRQVFDQHDGCYFNWTLVSLIHSLAVSGFDCASGFFSKKPNDPWISAAVYKSEHAPMDPRSTRWYSLADMKLLPESAARSVARHGYLRQQDLVLPWLDHSLTSFKKY